jgi:hypothetical protein
MAWLEPFQFANSRFPGVVPVTPALYVPDQLLITREIILRLEDHWVPCSIGSHTIGSWDTGEGICVYAVSTDFCHQLRNCIPESHAFRASTNIPRHHGEEDLHVVTMEIFDNFPKRRNAAGQIMIEIKKIAIINSQIRIDRPN